MVTLNVVHYLEPEGAKLAEGQGGGAGWENHVSGETIDETVKRLYGNDPPDYIVNSSADHEENKRVAREKTGDTPKTVMTAVMADKPQSAEELHLEAGENYVEINRDTWKEKLEY